MKRFLLCLVLTSCASQPERHYDKTILLVVEQKESTADKTVNAIKAIFSILPIP